MKVEKTALSPSALFPLYDITQRKWREKSLSGVKPFKEWDRSSPVWRRRSFARGSSITSGIDGFLGVAWLALVPAAYFPLDESAGFWLWRASSSSSVTALALGSGLDPFLLDVVGFTPVVDWNSLPWRGDHLGFI